MSTTIQRQFSESRYPVDIILPESWSDPVLYRLLMTMVIYGYEVPKNFVTDGGTIPRLFWWLFPPVCQYFPATVVHDYLLSTGHGRYTAWSAFRIVLRECDVPTWRRKLMVALVRVYDYYKIYFKGAPA